MKRASALRSLLTVPLALIVVALAWLVVGGMAAAEKLSRRKRA